MIRAFRTTILLTAMLAAAASTTAQSDGPRIVYGFFIGTAAKAGLLQRPKMRYQPWGEINAGMSIGITGANEHAMTARLHIQNSWDNITYRIAPTESYTIETFGLLINPEISIPLLNRYRESKLDLLGGIGADVLLDQTLILRNVMGWSSGTFLESLNDSIRAARHGVVPYATLGLAFKVNRRGSIIVRLRQDARNLFDGGSKATFYSSTGSETVNLSTQATRLLIGCQIILGKLPEMY